MRHMWNCVMLLLITVIGSGCAASGKQSPSVTAAERQQTRENQLVEQVDRNAATIRENKSALAEINQKLNDLESRINTTGTDQNASTQEIKENISFLNDQILRLDNSVRTKRPVPKPQSASVFKPGGFDIDSSYKGALNEYYAKRYESAINGFNEILTVASSSPLADNAQYWMGECYYSMGNFKKALEVFIKVFDFPESNKLPDSHLKIGITHLRLGNETAAKEELQAVVKNYPGTSAATKAAQQLRTLGE
ncbi:tol-pal system protein YbgF [Candidatus Latescibacterota bacterium]